MTFKWLLFSKIARIAQRLGASPPGPRSGILLSCIQSSQPTTFEIDKFDVLRGRLLGNHNDFHWQFTTSTSSGSRYGFPGVDHEGRQTCRL